MGRVMTDRRLGPLAPIILYRTLALPDGLQEGAVLLGLALRAAMEHGPSLARAGFGGTPLDAAQALFTAMLESPSGLIFAIDDWAEVMKRIGTSDRKICLVLPDLLAELESLFHEPAETRDPQFPLVLSAGERRSFTANTIIRDPAWRKVGADGALRMSPTDAATLGLAAGESVRVSTKRGSAIVPLELDDAMQAGHISLPNGFGLGYPVTSPADSTGTSPTTRATGVAPNELTSIGDRDRFVGTPWHKYVPARVERLAAEERV
jgi:anaerobic selenocysteine-containing dehydrogenase